MLPPWDLTWRDENGDTQFSQKAEFSGYHFITYHTNRPSKVIAWDGVGTGGKIGMTGYPSINIRLLLGEWIALCAVWAVFYLWKNKTLEKAA